MKAFLFFLTIILVNISFGQMADTTYFSEKRNKVATYGEANYFRVTKKLNDTTYSVNEYYTADKGLYMTGVYYDKALSIMNGQFLYYSEEGALIRDERYKKKNDTSYFFMKYYVSTKSLAMSGSYLDKEYKIKNGQLLYYSEDGKIIEEENFKSGIKHGRFYKHEKDGNYGIESIYMKDTLIEKHCIDSNNVTYDFAKVHSDPKILSGTIETEIFNAIDASKIYKEGQLILEIVIGESGSVKAVKITGSSLNTELELEVSKIVKKLKFKPATMLGKSVESVICVPIKVSFSD